MRRSAGWSVSTFGSPNPNAASNGRAYSSSARKRKTGLVTWFLVASYVEEVHRHAALEARGRRRLHARSRDVVAQRDAVLREILPASSRRRCGSRSGSRGRRRSDSSGRGFQVKCCTLTCASFSHRSPAYFQFATPVYTLIATFSATSKLCRAAEAAEIGLACECSRSRRSCSRSDFAHVSLPNAEVLAELARELAR